MALSAICRFVASLNESIVIVVGSGFGMRFGDGDGRRSWNGDRNRCSNSRRGEQEEGDGRKRLEMHGKVDAKYSDVREKWEWFQSLGRRDRGCGVLGLGRGAQRGS